MSNFLFFWNGPLSQWWITNFVIDDIRYSSCEQYMMAEKAKLFNDFEVYSKIMQSTDPREQKTLGKLVRNFNDKKWVDICKKIVYNGNLAKFSQNSELKDYLLSTGDKEIVEASAYDIRWGIGLSEDDPRRFDRSKWEGTNWLGIELMNARKTLKEENV